MTDLVYYDSMWCEPIDRSQLTSGLRVSFDLERSESTAVEQWNDFDAQLLLEGGEHVVLRLVFVAVHKEEIIYGVSKITPAENGCGSNLVTLAPQPY